MSMSVAPILFSLTGTIHRESYIVPMDVTAYQKNEANHNIELKQYASNSGFCQGQPNYSVRDATALWKLQRRRDSDLENKTLGR
jgi:hypothetical protein